MIKLNTTDAPKCITYFIILLSSLIILIDSSGDNLATETFNLANYARKIISFLSADYHHTQDVDSLLSSPHFKPHHCKVESQEHKEGAVTVLLLGDSIDRGIVFNLCHSNTQHNYNYSINWANISYRVRDASSCCTSPQFSVCTARIYGSSAKGPYAFGFENDDEDPHADTELRIPQCMGDYVAQFGKHPEFILLRTEIWDLKKLEKVTLPLINNTTSNTNNTTAITLREISNQFISDFSNDLKIIRQLSPNAILGTHTVPKITWGLDYFNTYLNAMRFLSEEEVSYVSSNVQHIHIYTYMFYMYFCMYVCDIEYVTNGVYHNVCILCAAVCIILLCYIILHYYDVRYY